MVKAQPLWHLRRINDVFSGPENQAKFRHDWLREAPTSTREPIYYEDLHSCRLVCARPFNAPPLPANARTTSKKSMRPWPPGLDADSRAQLEDMRNQAVQLCGAGNEAEGLDVTAEAKAMLNIQ